MRLLLKLSGQALGNGGQGFDHGHIKRLVHEIHQLTEFHEIALVIGWGNICRGKEFHEHGVSENTAHAVGMLSTVINGLLIQDALSQDGQKTYLYTARDISTVGEAFYARKAEKNLSEKKVVIISGGTGNPYFSTDTAWVLRSIEMSCDMMIKCTNVDGIYSADPKKDQEAEKYDVITYDEVLSKNLRFIDQTAIALAREHALPIGVCQIDTISKLATLKKDGAFFGSMVV